MLDFRELRPCLAAGSDYVAAHVFQCVLLREPVLALLFFGGLGLFRGLGLAERFPVASWTLGELVGFRAIELHR